MGTIADKLKHALDMKEEIRQAIIAKGGVLSEDAPLSEWRSATMEIISINDIPDGDDVKY